MSSSSLSLVSHASQNSKVDLMPSDGARWSSAYLDDFSRLGLVVEPEHDGDRRGAGDHLPSGVCQVSWLHQHLFGMCLSMKRSNM